MAFRMSEQPRTIKIYNLLAGTNEFIGEGDAYIPPHTGLPANSTDIAPPDIPATGKYHLVIPGRGVSEVERHSLGEGYGSRKTVPDPGGGRNKKQPDAGSQ